MTVLEIRPSINVAAELIQTLIAIDRYLTDLKDASKEIELLSINELASLMIHDDPWPEQLYGSIKELMESLERVEKRLKGASPGWKQVAKKRLHWTFAKQSICNDLKKIEYSKTQITIVGQHKHLILSCAIRETPRDVKGKAERNVDINEQTRMDERRTTVTKGLTSSGYNAVQRDKLTEHVGDTWRWCLEWVDGSAEFSTLWCSGSLGIRQTILTSIIIDHLRMLKQEKTLVPGIFCDCRFTVAQNVANLRSLLKQTVQGNAISSPMSPLYNQSYCNQTRPSLDALTGHLSQVQSFARAYFALNELIDNTGERKDLINRIRSSYSTMRHCLTSRVIHQIGPHFKEDTRFDIRAGDDVNMSITSKFSPGNLAELINGDDMREEILTRIAEKANGMFLLASLHMDSLAYTSNLKNLREAFAKLPGNVLDAYNETLARVDIQCTYQKDLAYCIFGWIAFARRPLTMLELQCALVEPVANTLDEDNINVEKPVIQGRKSTPKPLDDQEQIRYPRLDAITSDFELPCSVALHPAPTFQRRALLIGINGYSRNPLDGCLNDVNAFSRVLTMHYNFFPNEITIITDDTPQLPSRANILRALYELARDTEENGCLVVYYAGHGTRYSGSVYSTTPVVQESVVDAICPVDRGTMVDGGMVMDITSRDFDAILSEVRANVTVILDCCHGGTFIDVLNCNEGKVRYINGLPDMGRTLFQDPNPVPPTVLDNTSRVFLSACRWYEIALECFSERDNVTHGVFTRGLLDALELDVDQIVTYEQLISRIRPLPSQTPVIHGNGISSCMWTIPRVMAK